MYFRGRTHTHVHVVRVHANSTHSNASHTTNAFFFSLKPSTKEVSTDDTHAHLDQMDPITSHRVGSTPTTTRRWRLGRTVTQVEVGKRKQAKDLEKSGNRRKNSPSHSSFPLFDCFFSFVAQRIGARAPPRCWQYNVTVSCLKTVQNEIVRSRCIMIQWPDTKQEHQHGVVGSYL